MRRSRPSTAIVTAALVAVGAAVACAGEAGRLNDGGPARDASPGLGDATTSAFDGAPVDADGAGDASRDAALDARADAEACSGCGLWDPGFADGTWRTDFDDPAMGTAGKPLTLLPCAYALGTDPKVLNGAGPTYWDENTSKQVACDRTSTLYPASNASTSAAAWPLDRYWVVTANNERAFGLEGTCSDLGPSSGPPNQSKAVFAPGQGVFGIAVANGKATLALDTQAFPNCVSPVDKGKIPFLSLGAQTGRGQGPSPITYLNDPSRPAVVSFTATVEAIAPAAVTSSLGAARANFGYVFVEASWAGERRWVYVYLFARAPGPPAYDNLHWNWNVQESMWSGGADIVFVDADKLSSMCGKPSIVAAMMPAQAGATYSYSLDLNAVFQCIAKTSTKTWTAPMPSTPLAVTGLHWAVEQTYGKNWTTMSIANPRLTR